MPMRKKLNPRFKRKGDGTLHNDVKLSPKRKRYYVNYDKINWRENNGQEAQERNSGDY